MEPELKYVALTSVRNEERFIKTTVNGVLSQTPSPDVYVVVDDGSTDNTSTILSGLSGVTVVRVDNPRHPTRGVNLAWALNTGVQKLTELVPDWNFMLKVDGDSVLPRDYFRKLLKHLHENTNLGVTSGTPYDEKVWRGRASDGAKIYRRECFNESSGC